MFEILILLAAALVVSMAGAGFFNESKEKSNPADEEIDRLIDPFDLSNPYHDELSK